MQKIHNIIFYTLIVVLGLSIILLAFGNKALGIPLMILSIVLFIVESELLGKVVKQAKESVRENVYTPPSRMEFLEANLGDELIGKQKGFDEAVMGFDYHSMRLIYSVEKVIEILMTQNDWNEEEAREFAYHNTFGVRGENGPIWLECSIDIEL